jgi:hypothetical protein
VPISADIAFFRRHARIGSELKKGFQGNRGQQSGPLREIAASSDDRKRVDARRKALRNRFLLSGCDAGHDDLLKLTSINAGLRR